MTQFFKKNKTLLLGGVIVIAAAFAYFKFFSGGGAGAEVIATSAENSPVSQDLLLSLTTLYTIKLDDSLFKSDEFLSLSDFGVQIPPETIGRRNPFAPVGSQ